MSTIGVVDVPVPTAPGAISRTLATRRFGGGSLLEWVAQRITDVQAIDETVVLLGPEQADLANIAPRHIPVHLSSEPDSLGQMADVCASRGADAVVRVRVDTPFIDPVLVDQLVCLASEAGYDYVSYCSRESQSAVAAHLGIVGEWINADALKRADEQTTGEQRNCPTQAICGRPEQFNLKFLRLPKVLDRDDLRLVVSSEEDWEHAHQIIEALGPDDLDYQRIAVLLAEQPAIRRRMAALNEVS